MNNDIIRSWKCWCTDERENIITLDSVNNNVDDIPTHGVQAIRLWFYPEDISRFISGNKYYIIHGETLIDQPSSYVIQTDSVDEVLPGDSLKESSTIADNVTEEIFNLMIESIDPSL